MFLGHYAVGFALKRAAPRVSLGALMTAPLLLDLLWPIGLLTGLEHVRIDPGNTAVTPLDLHDYPYTHSLAMSLVWSGVLAIGFGATTRYWRGAVVIGLGVFSHWVLDWVTHRPDLPLYPGSKTLVGLGLWNSRSATILVEFGLLIIGVWLYATVAPTAQPSRGCSSMGSGGASGGQLPRNPFWATPSESEGHCSACAERVDFHSLGVVDRSEPRRVRAANQSVIVAWASFDGCWSVGRSPGSASGGETSSAFSRAA